MTLLSKSNERNEDSYIGLADFFSGKVSIATDVHSNILMHL